MNTEVKPKIVIIDDEESICQMYKMKLEIEGFSILTASDGQMGIEIVKKEKPALVLLDIIMPRLNGLDVLKILKEDRETESIPVLLLTNLPAEAGSSKGKELNAVGYLVKADYEPAALVAKVKEILKKK